MAPEEEGHHNRRRNDIVVENIQPARQFKIFDALFFFAQIRRDFIGNPGGKLLLVADGEAATVGDVLRGLVHHVGGDTPVERDQHRGADNGRPHWVAKDKEGNRNQPCLLEHDMASQHDGANTGNAAQQNVNDVQRQREQNRIPYPTVGIAMRSMVAIIEA